MKNNIYKSMSVDELKKERRRLYDVMNGILAGVEYGHEHEIAGNILTIVDELEERLGYVPPLIPEQHTVEP